MTQISYVTSAARLSWTILSWFKIRNFASCRHRQFARIEGAAVKISIWIVQLDAPDSISFLAKSVLKVNG
jgi:hypothetical protein